MHITMLGTSAMVPTKERNHAGVFLEYKAEGILIDCGEGIQRQFKIAGIPLTKTTRLLLTHWHGDHCFGVPGVIQSLGAMDYSGTLHIYGPPKTKYHLARLFEAFDFDSQINIEVHETDGGIIHNDDDFYIEALPLQHKVPCLGYSIIEKERYRINMPVLKKIGVPEGPHLKTLQEGKNLTYKGQTIFVTEATTHVPAKKVTYITDTRLCENAILLAKNADLVICESSYAHDLQEQATERYHLSARDTGLIASRAGAKKLVLTHFSARYKNTHEVEEDARDVFDQVVAAKDFMTFKV